MTQRFGIGWRTAAALAAAVVLLPLVVFVDIEPSAAHRQTTRRCDYDPMSGQQFNCRSVSVPHRHTSNNHAPPPDTSPTTTTTPPPTTMPPTTTVPVPNHYSPPPDTTPRPAKCPAGTTGTPPDCQPVPSDNTNRDATKCPAGTTGTPPDCQPVPSDNTNRDATKCPAGTTGTPPDCQPVPSDNTNRDATKCPAGTTGTPPDCVPDPCPAGTSGTPPDCVPDPCPAGTSGTPPDCVPEPPTECATGSHLHGSNCHLDHDWSEIPCGTGSDIGTWAPHAGHTPRQRPQCERENNGCSLSHPGLRFQHRHVIGANQNRGGATMSSCHVASTSHCPGGQHEHVHGSQECHALGEPVKNAAGTHSGWTDHCPAGQHSHEHSGSCHDASSEEAECRDNYQYSYESQTCELDPLLNIIQKGTNLYVEGTGQAVCSAVAGGASKKAADGILKNVGKFTKWAFGYAVELSIEHPCDQIWDRYQEHVKETLKFKPETVDPEDGDGSDGNDGGSNDGTAQQPNAPEPDPTPQFNPAADCHTWFPLLRACIRYDPDTGKSTITYH